MSTIATTEPAACVAGDTVQWLRTLADYPASDGWVLAYVFANAAGTFTVSTTASGADHLARAESAATDSWAAGDYAWQARVSRSGDVFTVGTGRTAVLPGLAGGTSLETRSQARAALDAINAYLADPGNLTAASYTIAGRSLSRRPIPELLQLKSHFAAEVAREDAAAALALGLPDRRRIYVRFGPQ